MVEGFSTVTSQYIKIVATDIVCVQIEKGHQSESSTEAVLRDYVDGSGFKEHELFSVKKDALQILFYYDDLEVCNPLGSKAKTHKLSNF